MPRIALKAILIALLFVTGAGSLCAQEVTVGISWSGFGLGRWRADKVAIYTALSTAGAKHLAINAQLSAEKQINDIENLIDSGVDAIIIVPHDAKALEDVVMRATSQGVPVISYDRLINNPRVFYMSFDSREVGRLQARTILKERPEGRYMFIRGAETDPNAELLYAGQLEVLADHLSSGKIINVGEVIAGNWSPQAAYRGTKEVLNRTGGKLDAIIASNDNLAAGAILALREKGLDGRVAVSGQDGLTSALNKIAKGTQTMTVWKDSRVLGRRAGEVAAFLARGGDPSAIPDAILYQGSADTWEVRAIFAKPRLITSVNLDSVVSAGWLSLIKLCRDVKPGKTPVCDGGGL